MSKNDKYYWECRECKKVWGPGQTGVANDPDSGWHIHEELTGHTVDPKNEVES